MVALNTTETINYIKDLDFEYNLKMLLLFIMLLYSFFFIWLTFKWDKDKHYVKLIKNFLIRIPFGLYIYFFPLMLIYTFRSVTWEIIYNFMVVFYSYSFIILMIAGKLGLFEFILDFLGYKLSPKRMESKEVSKKW